MFAKSSDLQEALVTKYAKAHAWLSGSRGSACYISMSKPPKMIQNFDFSAQRDQDIQMP